MKNFPAFIWEADVVVCGAGTAGTVAALAAADAGAKVMVIEQFGGPGGSSSPSSGDGGSSKPQRQTPPVAAKIALSSMYAPAAAHPPPHSHVDVQPIKIVRPLYETHPQAAPLRGSSHENTPPGSYGTTSTV